MEREILSLDRQLEYDPKVEGGLYLENIENFFVIGMGGSALAADLLNSIPDINISIHSDYGIPKKIPEKSLFILISHSGDTEEVIDAFKLAKENKLKMIVISTNGKLLKLAEDNNIPRIKLPDIDIEPRLAMGFHVKAILTVMGKTDLIYKINELAGDFKSREFENSGKELADWLKGRIPLIYSSVNNEGIANYFKISFNETGKIPAFSNSFPELNHNEMASFGNEGPDGNFACILIRDDDDPDIIKKRMDALKKIYNDKKMPVENIVLKMNDIEKIFSAVSLAGWTAYYLAEAYGNDPKDSSVVESFKEKIK